MHFNNSLSAALNEIEIPVRSTSTPSMRVSRHFAQQRSFNAGTTLASTAQQAATTLPLHSGHTEHAA